MRKFVKVCVTLCLLYAIIASKAAPGSPLEGDLAQALAQLSGGLSRDRALDVAARTHLRDIEKRPARAETSAVAALLEQMGEAPSRLRPYAVLGPPSVSRERQLRAAARALERNSGFTHLGFAESARGAVVLWIRRVVALRPIVTPSRPGLVEVRGRARPQAQLSAWILGPCRDRDTLKCTAPNRSVPVDETPQGFVVRFPLLRDGVWTVELVADVGLGPEVALLRQFVIGSASGSRQLVETSAPDRQETDGPDQWLARVRDAYDVSAITPDRRLHWAAEQHAQTVCRLGWAVHRPRGSGGPGARARRAGFRGRVIEGVAVAKRLPRAWGNLLRSPAHRHGLLDPTVDRYGLGQAEHNGQVCLVALLGRQR